MYFLTARKMRRILKFIQKRNMRVFVRYEYNNSIGTTIVRKHIGIIKDYKVTKDELDFEEIHVHITFDDGFEMKEDLSVDWGFMKKPEGYNGCKLYVDNNPYCYFSIKDMDDWQEDYKKEE